MMAPSAPSAAACLTVTDGAFRRGAGAAVIEMHLAGAHLHGLAHDRVALIRGEHRDLAGRAHEQDRRGAVFLMKLDQGSETLEVGAAVGIHWRDQGDERSGDQVGVHGRFSYTCGDTNRTGRVLSKRWAGQAVGVCLRTGGGGTRRGAGRIAIEESRTRFSLRGNARAAL